MTINSINDGPQTDVSLSNSAVAMADAVAGGWGHSEIGELFTNFPIVEADTVVDVGCGQGGYIAFAGQQGAHVVFADIDPQNVAMTERGARATRARAVTPIVSDCSPIPLPDGFATVVICTEVLEHVPDAAAMMCELVRIGAPGARYLLSVPDPASEAWQKSLAPPKYFQPPGHVRIFERAAFKSLVADHGLTIERWHAYGFYWSVFWAMFWSCGVPLGTSHPALEHWTQAWGALLQTANGKQVKAVLDGSIPKSQLILARKNDVT